MSSFSKEDQTFSSQFPGSEMTEQYPGMSYRDFWGDEYLWTALLPLSWKLIATGGRIRPTGNDHDRAIGWWSTPIHLLSLGMGWTNLALGLHNWRHAGFPDNNPVLRFVKDSYGPSIEALEAFLVTRENFNYELVETLQILGFSEFTPDDNLTADQYSDLELGDDEWYLETCKRAYDFGPRWEMAKLMLLGGSDSLHLSTHITNSLAFDDTSIHDDSELDDLKVLYLTEDRIGVEAPAYKGFPYRLIEAMSLHGEKYSKSPRVSFHIKTLGHIGDFHHSPETGRFFLAANPAQRDASHRLHLLGNLN